MESSGKNYKKLLNNFLCFSRVTSLPHYLKIKEKKTVFDLKKSDYLQGRIWNFFDKNIQFLGKSFLK